MHKALGQAFEHGVERINHRQQFFGGALAVEARGKVADADALGMHRQAPQRQQATMHHQVTDHRQYQRGDAGEDIDTQPVAGEHGGALGHQAPGGDLQAAQVARINGGGQGGEGHAIHPGQVLHVGEFQGVVPGYRFDGGHVDVAGVHLQQRLLPGRGNAQHRFAVAEHVLEQLWLGLDQVQGVAVVQQVAQLVDAVNQRGIVPVDQLALKVAVQRHAEGRQQGERQ